MDDQEKLQQLMQAYQAAKQQGTPDALNQTQNPIPNVMQGVGDPNNIPVSTPDQVAMQNLNGSVQNIDKDQVDSALQKGAVPYSSIPANVPSQKDQAAQTINGIPQYLSREGGQTDQYKNDFLNRILMAGLPEKLGGIKKEEDQPVAPSAKEPEEKDDTLDQQEELAKVQDEKPVEKKDASKQEDNSDDDENEDAPQGISQELKQIPKRDGQYDLNHLQAQMQASRQAAALIAGQMAARAGSNTITGKHTDMSGFKAAYANELGKAADYERLINQQRSEDEQDIKHAASQVQYNKALTELGNEKMQNDVNSSISTAARGIMLDIAKQSGMNINPDQVKNLSYSSISQLMPNIDKVLVAKLKTDELREVAAQRNQYMQMHQNEIMNKFYDQQGAAFGKAANAAVASARSGLGVHFRNLSMADRIAENIGTDSPSDKLLNGLNPQQVQSVITDYAAMMLGGPPTKAAIEELSARTGQKDFAKLAQYAFNEPQGANQAALLKPVLESVKRMREGSKQRIMQSIDTGTAGFAGYKRARPQDAQDVIEKAMKQLNPLDEQQAIQTQGVQQPGQQPVAPPPTDSVLMRAPNGSVKRVPKQFVDQAIKGGGVIIKE